MIITHELPQRLRFKSPVFNKIDGLYLEASLFALSGVRKTRLNPRANSLTIEYDGLDSHRQTIIHWLKTNLSKITMQLPAIHKTPSDPASFMGALTAGISLIILPFLPHIVRKVLTWSLITPTMIKGGKVLLSQGIKVEVLDSLAVGLAAWRNEYFTAIATYGLLELGEYLEANTQQHADGLLRHLLKPMPTTVWVERENTLIEIACSELVVGDHIEVGTGNMIPIDGKVIQGNAAVNQASITGENLAVRKEKGDKVLSGTVIEEGRLRIYATRVGDNTTTARIAHFIENALQQQSNTQCLAENLANQRVYITLGLGALVYAFTRDTERLASVFLVDYACALKLGTPVAIKSAMYKAATHGLLFRNGQAIENLAEADTFVFDKTGTLTTGLLKVTEVESFDPEHWDSERLLALAASIEEHATHPVAEAIVNQAQKFEHIEHEEVDYIVAHGLTSQIDGKQVIIGSRHFLEEHKNIIFNQYDNLIQALEDAGKTLLYIALNGKPLGLLALQDAIRPEAKQILQALRQAGVKKLILLTGDNRNKAEALAETLGMDAVHAECPPELKGEVVKQLHKTGHKIAFIGDGVNDAPALVAADVGIAMPKGADLARAAAEVVLLNDNLHTLVNAKILSNKTMQLIQMHFNLSTGVNTGVIAGAAMGWLNPFSSALLHNGATIGVLLNSIAGVSLKTKPLEALQEKYQTLRTAYEE